MVIRRRQSHRVQLDNDKYAFIDHDGNVVSRSTDTHGHTPKAKPGSKLDNGKYAFIDHDGNVVSKEYKDAWPYAEGKAGSSLITASGPS